MSTYTENGGNPEECELTLLNFIDCCKNPEFYSPIPIEEVRLKEFGFTKNGSVYKSKLFGSTEWIELDNDAGLYTVFYTQEDLDGVHIILMGKPLEYVHDLQNLYLALVGKPLNN